MSIFKTQGIIIKIKKQEEKNNLYTIFTADYGKILTSKKLVLKEKTLDLGYLINFEIEVKQGVNIHKIKNIKIIGEFNSFGKQYSIIHSFLELLNIVNTKLPEKLTHLEIYYTLETLIKYEKLTSNELTKQRIILIQLKLLDLLGTLNIEHENVTIKKILHYIHKNKSGEILKLTGINKEVEEKLEETVRN
ncbi:recombination protein O N-terminal domain-containing protein [Candidatus Gracilibacteria bacterium]|nr:recombination protein O N-terminal domain-containing protein [Candidatus Gracilibacteria bacterium]